MNEYCDKITDILQFECKEVTYTCEGDILIADLDCYCLLGSTLRDIVEFVTENHLCFVVTTQRLSQKMRINFKKIA